MKIKMLGKQVIICGLRGTGKTELSKHILRQQPRSLVVDPLEEYNPKKFKVYRPDSILNPKTELTPQDEIERLIAELVKPNAKAGKLQLLVIDEANRFFPAREPLGYYASEMLDLGRHWSPTGTEGLTVVYLTRRPVQLNTNIIELADFRICFYLTGRNDLQYLADIRKGWDDEVQSLPEYHFSVHHRRDTDGVDYHKCLPIDIVENV